MYKILVIEDESEIRKFIVDYFSSNGFEVYEARDGIEGFQNFEYIPE